MRDALSLTDQAIAFGSGALAETGVRQMLGSVDRSYVYQLLDALAGGDGKSIVELSEVLRLNGFSAASTLEEMTTVLQRMAVLQAVPGVGAADDATDPDIAETARLAQLLPADETQLLYSLCLHGRGELGLAPDEYAALTMVLLRLLPFKRPVSGVALAGGAAESLKKPQAESPGPATVPTARPALAPTPAPAPVPAPASAVSVIAPAAGLQAPRVEADFPLVSSLASAPKSSEIGDAWAERVQALMAADLVAGLVRELALQSELQSQEGGVWTLQVESQSLNHAGACDKLLQALQALPAAPGMPAPARLQVAQGPVSDTPARRLSAAQTERQRLAEEVIAADPFVQDMVRQWGARIVPGSVRPLASDAAKPI
jgi:DNA polymerase-3 subunit gamma/tau